MSILTARFIVRAIAEYKGNYKEARLLAVTTGETDENDAFKDNNYAKGHPKAEMSLVITNPAMLNNIKIGDVYTFNFIKEERQ